MLSSCVFVFLHTENLDDYSDSLPFILWSSRMILFSSLWTKTLLKSKAYCFKEKKTFKQQ